MSENICYFLDMMKMVLDIYYREDGELKCVGGVVTVKRMHEVLAYWRKNKRSLSSVAERRSYMPDVEISKFSGTTS